ncbi:MAG: nitroreductase family protein [Parabacteroides sp.]|nr:nitroreductase family protein [Parabacteroides sp.]
MAKLIAEWMDTDCRNDPVLSKRYDINSILKRFKQGKDVILRGAPCVAFTVGPRGMTWGGVDSGIALTYFNLAAEAHNIGCCFAGYASNAASMSDALRDYLGIKPDEECYCAICFGHKTIVPHRVPGRPAVTVNYL